MKGPLVFAAALVAAAAVGFVLVRPLYRAPAPSAAARAGDPDRPVREAAERLRAALRAPSAVLAELEQTWGPLLDRSATPPAATVELPWDRLPELLSRLARPGEAAPAALTVEAAPDPARCRVRLEFEAVPTPAGAR